MADSSQDQGQDHSRQELAESLFSGSDDTGLDPSSPWYVRLLTANLALFMFLMTAVMFTDVVGRYVINKSIQGGFEIIGFLLGILIFSGFALISRDEAHITVGLLDHVFRGRARRIRDMCIQLGNTVVLAFIASRLWVEGESMREAKQFGEILDFEVWPFIHVLTVLAVITTILHICLVWESFTGKPPGSDDQPHQPDESLI